MGENKALKLFLGQPLLVRVAGRLSAMADELLIVGGTFPPGSFPGLPILPDLLPGEGALGGLLTALTLAQYSLVVVVACDMPFVNPSLLAEQVRLLEQAHADVAIPALDADHLEPLHAVYRRETCLPAVQAALASGEKQMVSWFANVKVLKIPIIVLRTFDPLLHSFTNLNTPKEFADAEVLARLE